MQNKKSVKASGVTKLYTKDSMIKKNVGSDAPIHNIMSKIDTSKLTPHQIKHLEEITGHVYSKEKQKERDTFYVKTAPILDEVQVDALTMGNIYAQ